MARPLDAPSPSRSRRALRQSVAIEVDQGVHRQRPGAGRREFEQRRRERRGQRPQRRAAGRARRRRQRRRPPRRRAGRRPRASGLGRGPAARAPPGSAPLRRRCPTPPRERRPPPATVAWRRPRGRLRRPPATRRRTRAGSPRRARRARDQVRSAPPWGPRRPAAPGPSTIALGSHGVPGGVTSATKPSPSVERADGERRRGAREPGVDRRGDRRERHASPATSAASASRNGSSG